MALFSLQLCELRIINKRIDYDRANTKNNKQFIQIICMTGLTRKPGSTE